MAHSHTESCKTGMHSGCTPLEVGKIYRVINDEVASANGLIRIVDESEEDYAFSSNRFYPIEVPKPVEEVLLIARAARN